MTIYKITATRENGTEFSDTVCEASESMARKAFKEIYRHGKFTISGVEAVEENAPASREQERKALEQIKAIVATLGPDSYIATAFEGCFEIAEENIENDFGCSMKQRAEQSEKDATRYQEKANHFAAELKRAQEKIAQLEKKVLADDDLTDISQLIADKRFELNETVKTSAETIVKYAELPDSKEFKQAVLDHRNAKKSMDYYTALSERVCRASKQ